MIHIETAWDHPEEAGRHICSIPKRDIGNANLLYRSPDLVEILEKVLSLNHLCNCSDIDIQKNAESGYAPEIREEAETILAARRILQEVKSDKPQS